MRSSQWQLQGLTLIEWGAVDFLDEQGGEFQVEKSENTKDGDGQWEEGIGIPFDGKMNCFILISRNDKFTSLFSGNCIDRIF